MASSESSYESLYKILIIGNATVGKSSLLRRFCDDVFDAKYMFTIGVDFKISTINLGDHSVKMQIWDTAGQERFKTITSSYYKGSHGVMIVYSIADRDSFTAINTWMEELRKYISDDIKVMIVGNKADMEDEREVSTEEAYELAKSMGLYFLETSARTSKNVKEAFKTMAKSFEEARKIEVEEPGRMLPTNEKRIKLNTEEHIPTKESGEKKKKKKCC